MDVLYKITHKVTGLNGTNYLTVGTNGFRSILTDKQYNEFIYAMEEGALLDLNFDSGKYALGFDSHTLPKINKQEADKFIDHGNPELESQCDRYKTKLELVGLTNVAMWEFIVSKDYCLMIIRSYSGPDEVQIPDFVTHVRFTGLVKTKLKLSGGKGLTSLSQSFMGSRLLMNLDLSKLDVSDRIRDLSGSVINCPALETVTMPENMSTKNVVSIRSMFRTCPRLNNSIVKFIENMNTSNIREASQFLQDSNISGDLDLSNWDMSKIESFSEAFDNCSKLTSITFSDTSTPVRLRDMSSMFRECRLLESIHLGKWELQKVNSMKKMFSGCVNLVNLNIEDITVEGGLIASGMFAKCKLLRSIDLTNFKIKVIYGLESMFSDCHALEYVRLDHFDTSNALTFEEMFMNCYRLEKVNLSNFVTPRLENINRMFYSCKALKEVDISNLDLLPRSGIGDVFLHCYNLDKIHKKPLTRIPILI